MIEKCRILSIDGGGIRGVFPAQILASIEDEIGEGNIHKHFDLICGTSTGGIIALALSLGIPAREILNLYRNNASTIFGSKRRNFFKYASYNNKPLEDLLKEIFNKYHIDDSDPRVIDAQVKLLIPTYSLVDGKTQILKTPHSTDLLIDKHIPMYMVGMATSAAPTYFNAYSNTFRKQDSNSIEHFSNKVDGGVYANNPALLGVIEAQTRLESELSDIELFSIGTGHKKFTDTKHRKRWPLAYWIMKKRLIDLFMQSQAQITHNTISVLKKFNDDFIYHRIDTEYDNNFNLQMDDTDKNKLDKLMERAQRTYQEECNYVLDTFFSSRESAAAV